MWPSKCWDTFPEREDFDSFDKAIQDESASILVRKMIFIMKHQRCMPKWIKDKRTDAHTYSASQWCIDRSLVKRSKELHFYVNDKDEEVNKSTWINTLPSKLKCRRNKKRNYHHPCMSNIYCPCCWCNKNCVTSLLISIDQILSIKFHMMHQVK